MAENNEKQARLDLLKSYVGRLSKGEDLESVRKDFVDNFADVEAIEIAQAEQALISGGVPVAEVQKLCDVHSALFHGKTKEERIANAEAAVNAGGPGITALEIANGKAAAADGKAAKEAAKAKAIGMAMAAGHPVKTLKDENKEIQARIDSARKALEGGDEGAAREALGAVRVAATHYSWKGDLIYPLLKTKYGVSGPSDVMWGVDDEIRDELGRLAKAETLDETWKKDVSAVLTRAEEMIYKENNILTPICVQYFSDSEWALISKELLAYDAVAGERKALPEAEAASRAAVDERVAKYAGNTENAVAGAGVSAAAASAESAVAGAGASAAAASAESADSSGSAGGSISADTRIELGREGHLTVREIAALLNTIPGEISFVDENDINRYFNAGEKLFKRPQMALDREVYSCHPPKVEQMARAIIAELRAGTKDKVSVPMVKAGKKVIVNYMAVRDEAGYVGTLEFVQEVPEFPQM